MTKILIRGTQAQHSVGVQAMTICTMDILDKSISNAKFIIFSPNPEIDHKLYDRYGFDLSVVVRRNTSNAVFRLFCAILWGMLRKLFGIDAKQLLNDEILQTISNADIIVDMFGDGFSDNTGAGKSSIAPIGHIFQILLGASLRKTIVLYPQSIGPFRNKLIRYLAKFSLNKVESITAREEITKNYLEEIGVNKTPIYLTADMAFILEPTPYEKTEKILSEYNINKSNGPLIGINISQLLIYRSKNVETTKQEYIGLMAKLADYLTTTFNAVVVFLPHAIFPKEIVNEAGREREADIPAVKETYEKVKKKDKVIPFVNEYSASELKGIIGQCDMFIGARMHANIAAISSCVPTIAIAYSPKAPGIMKMVGLERYVCDFKTITFEELKSKADEMWHNREKIKEEMRPKVEELKESVWFNGKLVKDLLDKRK